LIIAKHTVLGMWLSYPWKDLSRWDLARSHSEKVWDLSFPGLKGVRINGKIDSILLDKVKGSYWVRELKTSGLTTRQFRGRCQTSAQAMCYIWAARSLGFPVEGVIFEEIVKPKIRKRVTETAETFGQRIISDYTVDTEERYTQIPIIKTQDDIRRWLDDTRGWIRNIRKDKSYSRNYDYCWSFNSSCPYDKICFCDAPDEITLSAFYTKGNGHAEAEID
jgi:hypothetical protein